MGGSGKDTEKPGGQRAIEGYVLRMTAQEPGRHADHVIQPSRGLKSGGCRDDGHDDEHHVHRYLSGRKPENEHKDENTHHSIDSQADAADLGTYEYHGEYYHELDENQSSSHMSFSVPFSGIGGHDPVARSKVNKKDGISYNSGNSPNSFRHQTTNRKYQDF